MYFPFKKKRALKKFRKQFKSFHEIVLSLARDEEGYYRSFDQVDFLTSVGALVAVAHLANNTSVLRAQVSESQLKPFISEIDYLLEDVAKSCIREIERQENRTINRGSQEALDIEKKLIKHQEDKINRYMVALGDSMTKARGSGVGQDLAYEVQKDVYGEEITDVIFSLSLLHSITNGI